jgi:hypothetical protein
MKRRIFNAKLFMTYSPNTAIVVRPNGREVNHRGVKTSRLPVAKAKPTQGPADRWATGTPAQRNER